MPQLENKVGIDVGLKTFAVNIDWEVMKNYGDSHYWFEEIIGIKFTEPDIKPILDCESFYLELGNDIAKRQTDINYSLFSNGLQKKYITSESDIDAFRNELIAEGKIEMYEYEFNSKIYHDGIRIVVTENNNDKSAINENV